MAYWCRIQTHVGCRLIFCVEPRATSRPFLAVLIVLVALWALLAELTSLARNRAAGCCIFSWQRFRASIPAADGRCWIVNTHQLLIPCEGGLRDCLDRAVEG